MLPVQFGTTDHFRTDYVNFMIADFKGTYHAILGRPMLTKFMAIPHYRYLVLKMPTEKGVLTLRGNVYAAYTYEEDSFKIAEAHDHRNQRKSIPARRLSALATFKQERASSLRSRLVSMDTLPPMMVCTRKVGLTYL